jgi:DNA ligase (NAD+)
MESEFEKLGRLDLHNLRQVYWDQRRLVGDYCLRYYNLLEPLVSDGEFDDQLELLAKLEYHLQQRTGEPVDETSPTQTVGANVAGGGDVPLDPHMLSLRKVHSLAAVSEWMDKTLADLGLSGDLPLVVQPKLNGVAVQLQYENGRLKHAATRGNGTRGRDYIHTLVSCSGIPIRLALISGAASFCGEVVMPGGDGHAAAAAAVRYGKDIAQAKFFCTDAIVDGPLCAVPSWSTYGAHSLDEIDPEVRGWCAANSIPTDGVVFKVADEDLRKQLGATKRHPNWAVALK